MKRFEAIKTILDSLKDNDIALFATGMISREAFFAEDRKASFYMIGSMGLVSSVGLGIALNTGNKVVIFDGDGSVLMDMGTMAMIASERPNNLVHIVLDNESYQSTGNQPTISKKIDLSAVAKAVGYKKVVKITEIGQVQNELDALEIGKGPIFVLIKVAQSGLKDVPRVSHTPEELTRRLLEVIG
jgi:thiamine pyrophosphate-dependent acetolactate synthase large subunit-like protein